MKIILGFDGLEYEYVKLFNCKEIMQRSFGKTDISEFSEPRTIVLWSSFLSQKNLEKEILKLGNKDMWKFKLNKEKTFFKNFNKFLAIDVPGFTYNYEKHEKEKEAMKKYLQGNLSIQEYDEICMKIHQENKNEFFEALEKDYEIIMFYTSLADSIGHLSFGIKSKMKIIYKELEGIVNYSKKFSNKILILSDHGMKAVGRFGDHNDYGFWSMNKEINEKVIKLVDIYKVFKSRKS